MGELDGDSNIFAHALWMRSGDGQPRYISPCLAAYVWTASTTLDVAARDAVDELVRIRPNVVIPHAGTGALLRYLPRAVGTLLSALDVRDLPPVRLWVGVGIDGTLDAWHAGKLSDAQVLARHVEVAQMIATMGVEAIVLNGESKWAIRAGSIRKTADVRRLADALGKTYATHAPECVLLLSSFGALGYHSDVRALIEGLTPHCGAFTGQSYAARPGEVIKGVLPAILERDERSQEATERQSWMRPDEPEANGDESADDLDRLPTVQAHKTHPSDLCTVAVELPHVLVWSVPTIKEGGRADEEGLQALEAASAIRREVGTGPGAVARFQRAHGLAVDGRAGPATRAESLRSK